MGGLTDSRVVENLFHLLEKLGAKLSPRALMKPLLDLLLPLNEYPSIFLRYRRLSPQLQSMLVELIYSIVKADCLALHKERLLFGLVQSKTHQCFFSSVCLAWRLTTPTSYFSLNYRSSCVAGSTQQSAAGRIRSKATFV